MSAQNEPREVKSLVEQAAQFLRGTKTAESLSSELAASIYVDRHLKTGQTLDEVLANALAAGEHVVITGSAGGGKTMLLERIRRRLEGDSSLSTRVNYIADFTACGLHQEERANVLSEAFAQGPTVVAANEGPLLSPRIREVMPDVVPVLRQLQQGQAPNDRENGIFRVVDLAALDPVAPAVSEFLRSRLLRDAALLIEAEQCSQYRELGSCPRTEAFAQLDLEGMPEFVEYVVQLGTSAREVLFRHVWDFVADLLVGGTCEGDTPSSPWFWRLFFGDKEIARDIRSTLKPEFLTIPRGLPYIFQGDWSEVENWKPEIAGSIVETGVVPARLSETAANELMLWFKVQLAMLLRTAGYSLPRFPGEDSASLERDVLENDRLDRLLQHLNAYFLREKVDSRTPSTLILWVDTTSQRMEKRPDSMVGLGALPENVFELRRSRVVSRVPSGSVAGSRVFLAIRGKSEVSIPLVPALFDALSRGRPLSTRVRGFDDVDFAIRNFYLLSNAFDLANNPSDVRLLESGVEGSRTYSWRIQSGSRVDAPVVT